jgi:butyryl-CoA dehydrogenase
MMYYELTEEQRMLQTMAADFAKKEVEPIAKELDETAEFPFDLVKKMGENKFFGLITPPEYGGVGAGYLAFLLVYEQICTVSVAAAFPIWYMPFDADVLYRYGNDYLKQNYLIPIAEGKKITTLGFSEPETGVFLKGIATKAEKVGDDWVINGTKRFNTLSAICDFGIFWTRTSERGLTVFLIEREKTPGWSNPRQEQLMGRRGIVSFDCFLEDVHVPEENLVGELDQGFGILTDIVARVETPAIAGESVGIAQSALNEAVNFAQTRVQPWTGKPITVYEGIQYRFADMAADIEASRAMLYALGKMLDKGEDTRVESAKTKLFCAGAANRVVNSAIVVHSGYGFTKDFAIERIYRDQKLSQLWGGTEDIQRMIIGTAVGRGYR